jgi:hypothetical protein
MLSKKHFIEFADFLVEEELKIIPRYNEMTKKLNELTNLDNFWLSNNYEKNREQFETLEKIINTAKSEILEKMNKQHRELTSEIMLILDKNSLRFNKYQFKNYIISHVEKKQLNNANKEHTIQLNI